MLSLNNMNKLFLMIIISLCLLSTNCNAGFFDDVGGFFNDIADKGEDVGKDIANKGKDVGKDIADTAEDVGNEIDDFFDNVGDGITDAVDAVKKATEQVKNLMNRALEIDNIKQCVKDGNKQLKSIGDSTINDAKIILDEIDYALSKCYNKLKNPVETLLSKIKLENYSKDTINQILNILKSSSDCTIGNFDKKTLTIELESSFTVIGGVSISAGLAIDFETHKMYLYAAGCGYIGTDLSLSINSDISAYVFNEFNDVSGCSKFYSLGTDTEIIDIGLGATVVFNVPTTKRIAIGGAAGIGIGVSAFPAGAEYGTCYTITPVYCGKF